MNTNLKNAYKASIIFLSCALTLNAMEIAWPEPAKHFLVEQSEYPHLKSPAIYRKNIFEWLTGITEKDFVDY